MLNAFWWARKVLETNTDIKDLTRIERLRFSGNLP